MNIPACISGAADCVLKWTASQMPHERGDRRERGRDEHGDSTSPSTPGQCTPSAKPTISSIVIGISARRQAERTVPASSDAARRGRDEQAVEPALLDVAREVDAGRGAGERRALEQADRERGTPCSSSVAKPGSWVRLPNTDVSPSRNSVGARTPGIAAPGTRTTSFSARRISTPSVDAARSPSQPPSAGGAAPQRSGAAPIATTIAIAERGPSSSGPAEIVEMIGLAQPVGDEAQRVVVRDRLRRLEQQVARGRTPTTGTGSRRRAGRSPARRSRVPLRSAIAAPSPPNATRRRAASRTRISSDPEHAGLDRRAEDHADREEPDRADHAHHGGGAEPARPRSRRARSARRAAGR